MRLSFLFNEISVVDQSYAKKPASRIANPFGSFLADEVLVHHMKDVFRHLRFRMNVRKSAVSRFNCTAGLGYY